VSLRRWLVEEDLHELFPLGAAHPLLDVRLAGAHLVELDPIGELRACFDEP
jgi:hypothetical protein